MNMAVRPCHEEARCNLIHLLKKKIRGTLAWQVSRVWNLHTHSHTVSFQLMCTAYNLQDSIKPAIADAGMMLQRYPGHVKLFWGVLCFIVAACSCSSWVEWVTRGTGEIYQCSGLHSSKWDQTAGWGVRCNKSTSTQWHHHHSDSRSPLWES